jgi:hypothetical protein
MKLPLYIILRFFNLHNLLGIFFLELNFYFKVCKVKYLLLILQSREHNVKYFNNFNNFIYDLIT